MVCVIMSTYNGEQYIRQQLASILEQTYKGIQVLIRDDGSSDKTVEILHEYQSRYPNIQYYTGNNMGAAQSFYDLLKHVPMEADYIAFSDQDDVWLEGKVKAATSDLIHEMNNDLEIEYKGYIIDLNDNQYELPNLDDNSFNNETK